jgi:hypothetical protein
VVLLTRIVMRRLIPGGLVFLLLPLGVSAAPGFKFQGQASGWAGAGYDTSLEAQAGLRYLPGISFGLPLAQNWSLDIALAANGLAFARARFMDTLNGDARVKPYRLWLRMASPRFEARLGLQKINFGSATLLRPLMWFDQIDPRDPLQLTDGVYALLLRYYFQNNANVWLWGLAGNSVPKGWEMLPSEKWSPELGGRAQILVPRGEVAATYHHRQADMWNHPLTDPFVGPIPVREDRFALDGKWDIGIGLWLEAVMTRQSSWLLGVDWQRIASAGADYTFALGSGLGILAEHMVAGNAGQAFGNGSMGQLSALSLSYPLALVDNLRGLAVYDWGNKGCYRYLSWQRTLDRWIFIVALFWNPDQPRSYQGQPGSNSAAGKGVQLMVVFNH